MPETNAKIGLYELLPENHFRLLRIDGMIDDRIHCSLAAWPIDEAPRYVAISYTWGAPEDHTGSQAGHNSKTLDYDLDTRIIRVNEKPFDVRPNLYDLLLELEGEGGTYWIDAICINQCDEDEKSDQVNRMASIYETAQCTLIWLGTANETVSLALETINLLVKTFYDSPNARRGSRELMHILSDPEQRQQHGLEGLTQDAWKAFYDFYSRSWFSRAWTFQEVVLAQRVRCRCGQFEIQWAVIPDIAHTLSSLQLEDTLRLLFNVSDVGRFSLSLGHLYFTHLVQGHKEDTPFARLWFNQASIYSSTGALLYLCLSKLANLRCKDPRDKVYSLLGIVARAVYNSRAGRVSISADYSKSVVDVYTEVMAYILNDTGVLTPLAAIQYPSFISRNGMPSWTLNFTDMKTPSILTLHDRVKSYNAASFDASAGTCVGFSIVRQTLEANCLWYSRVICVSESWDEIVEHCSLARLAELCRTWSEQNSKEKLKNNDLWNIMLCDIRTDGGPELTDTEIRTSFGHFLLFQSRQYLREPKITTINGDLRHHVAWLDPLESSLEPEQALRPSTATIQANYGSENEFLKANYDIVDRGSFVFRTIASRTMTRRRIFLLDSGEIGLGADGVQPGDQLCILANGGKTPFLLRNTNEARAEFRLIGDAYVRDIMCGEAVHQMKKDGKTWEKICIM